MLLIKNLVLNFSIIEYLAIKTVIFIIFYLNKFCTLLSTQRLFRNYNRICLIVRIRNIVFFIFRNIINSYIILHKIYLVVLSNIIFNIIDICWLFFLSKVLLI